MADRADILVVGALHLDVVVEASHLPALDETVTGRSVRYVFGGKGGNQAVAAARMGAAVAIAGAVGSDGFAETVLAALDRDGVERTQVMKLPGATGMSVAIVDASGGYGAVIVSGVNHEIDAGAVTLPLGCRALILQNEVPEAVNLALATRAKAASIKVILNAAPARPLAPELLDAIDLLVVNRIEAEQMSGKPNPEAALDALRGRHLPAVIVTLGGDGLIGDDGIRFRQSAPRVTVVSTHGAGDAFIGALAAEWMRGATLPVAARFGQMAAALHVSAPVDARNDITERQVREALQSV